MTTPPTKIDDTAELECPSCNTDEPSDYRNGCEDSWHVDAREAPDDDGYEMPAGLTEGLDYEVSQ
jgi:hypothetical protein